MLALRPFVSPGMVYILDVAVPALDGALQVQALDILKSLFPVMAFFCGDTSMALHCVRTRWIFFCKSEGKCVVFWTLFFSPGKGLEEEMGPPSSQSH